jgi:hypothetical protein
VEEGERKVDPACKRGADIASAGAHVRRGRAPSALAQACA